MYKLITFSNHTKHEFESIDFDEILSIAMGAFNANHELHVIEEDEIAIYLHKEIYDLLKKAVY